MSTAIDAAPSTSTAPLPATWTAVLDATRRLVEGDTSLSVPAAATARAAAPSGDRHDAWPMTGEERHQAASVPGPRAVRRWEAPLERARRRLALIGVPPSAADASSDLEARFVARCRELDAPSVLELGTKQSVPGRSTMHRDWVPHAAEFLGTDIEPGATWTWWRTPTGSRSSWGRSAST